MSTPTTRATALGHNASAELRGRLTFGRWVRDLGEGPWLEQYLYTFSPDGTYTSKFRTDFDTPTAKGRWVLELGANGQNHLRLSDQRGRKEYYWLGRDSIVRVDEALGDLLVSGPGYAGEQRLRHER